MYRRRSGLFQQELAVLIGIEHGASVKRYEAAQSVPDLKTAIGIAIALDQPVEEVFAGLTEEVRAAVIPRAAALLEAMSDKPTHQNILKLGTLSRLVHLDDDTHIIPCEESI